MPISDEQGAPWFRHRWPWLLMLGPAIVLVAGGYTAWLAVSHPDALVVGDYYKRGKAINQDLSRERAAAALGIAVELGYDAAGAQLRGRVTSQGAALREGVIIHLAHATLPDKDVRLLALPDERGEVVLALPMLERSRWQVQVEAQDKSWRLGTGWDWPAQRNVVLNAQ